MSNLVSHGKDDNAVNAILPAGMDMEVDVYSLRLGNEPNGWHKLCKGKMLRRVSHASEASCGIMLPQF